MKRIARLVSRYAQTLGRTGAIGLGLLVFSVAFAASALAPLYQEREAARAKRDRALARLAARLDDRVDRPVSVEAQLARFAGHFPSPERARREMLELQTFASRHGLKLRSGEYRVAADAASGLIRHQVAIPVTGPYLSLRAFVAAALEQVPTIALESASFKRESAGAAEIEARMTFTLYASGSQ